jgi:hypothetical protein
MKDCRSRENERGTNTPRGGKQCAKRHYHHWYRLPLVPGRSSSITHNRPSVRRRRGLFLPVVAFGRSVGRPTWRLVSQWTAGDRRTGSSLWPEAAGCPACRMADRQGKDQQAQQSFRLPPECRKGLEGLSPIDRMYKYAIGLINWTPGSYCSRSIGQRGTACTQGHHTAHGKMAWPAVICSRRVRRRSRSKRQGEHHHRPLNCPLHRRCHPPPPCRPPP